MKRVKQLGLVLTVCLMLILWAIPVCAEDRILFDVVENVRWDEDAVGVARWDKVEKAKLYEVLLQEDELIVKRVEVSANKADLIEYMEEGHIYTFMVRAVPKSSQKTYLSGEWVLSDETSVHGIGDTAGRFRTYREGNKYQLEDGSYVTNRWQLIQSYWYYFDEAGYMKTGWQQIGQKWYYLGTNGKMQTGWIQLDGIWYYLQEDGSRYTGWFEYRPGQWYYLDTDGKMLTDTVVDGYQLDSSGLWTY